LDATRPPSGRDIVSPAHFPLLLLVYHFLLRDIVSSVLIPLLLLLLLNPSCTPRCVRCQAAVAVAAEGEDEDYFGDELSDEALIALITQVCTQTTAPSLLRPAAHTTPYLESL